MYESVIKKIYEFIDLEKKVGTYYKDLESKQSISEDERVEFLNIEKISETILGLVNDIGPFL